MSSVLLFFRLETRGILIDLMDANIPILELPAVCVDSGIEREALWDTGGGRCSAVVVTLEKAPLLRIKTEMEVGTTGSRRGGEFLAGDGAPFCGQIRWECR